MRCYLDDRSKAQNPDTLMCCHAVAEIRGRSSPPTGCSSVHGEGAARILKAQAYYNLQDEFECKLLLSLEGSVLFEALINPRIHFSLQEWKTISVNDLGGCGYEVLLMGCLA